MAKSTVIIGPVEVVTTVNKPVGVTLQLSLEEAVVLQTLLANVGGSCACRDLVNLIFDSLGSADVRWVENGCVNSIEFSHKAILAVYNEATRLRK